MFSLTSGPQIILAHSCQSCGLGYGESWELPNGKCSLKVDDGQLSLS